MMEALQAGNMVLATGYLFGGAALNYLGFRLHQLAIFAIGAVWGILLGAGGSAALDGGHINFLAMIVLAVVMGFVALAAQFVAIFLIGALIAGIAAAALGMVHPLALLIAGLIGGAIALGLYKTAIVFGTRLCRSVLMTFAVLTFIAIGNGETGLSLPNLFSYITKFVVSVVKSGDPAVAKSLATTHVMIFAVILSGLAVQLGLMQRAAADAVETPTPQPPLSPFDAKAPSSSNAHLENANASVMGAERRAACALHQRCALDAMRTWTS